MFRRPVVVRRRGAPLLGTAIVGGAAYAAGKSAQRDATRGQDQEQRLAQLEQQQTGMSQQAYQTAPQSMSQQPPSQPQMQQQAAPSAAEPVPDKLAQLKTLGELRASGVLNEAEFELEKQKILRA